MDAQQRLQTTLDLLASKASVSINDLVDRLHVTAMTVRRDLETLDEIKPVITDSSLQRDTISRLESKGIEVSPV